MGVNSQPPRKRWDRLEDQLNDPCSSVEHRPPYPALISDVIWLVFRIDAAAVAPFVPPVLTMSPSLIGVLGIWEAPSGSRLSPYRRALTCVAIEGYDAPDTKEAVYIVGEVVTENAVEAMRTNYFAGCLSGEPRIWWEDGLLHGAVSTGGVEWLRAVVRPSGPAQPGVTGLDAYVGTSKSGLSRTIVSYFGAVAPAEVVSLEIADEAPAAFRALRPTEIMLGLTASGLNATWGEPQAIEAGPPLPPRAREPGPRDAADMLVSIKLTPAEARLAVLVGKGNSARQAASQLGITEHTARSTLKQIYGKLGIRNRAALGHLIARLQFG